MQYQRYFSSSEVAPLHEVLWEDRRVRIEDADGVAVFEQENVRSPVGWSQIATNIAASKYFHGSLGTPERESDIGQLISRVADTISEWGYRDGYFDAVEDSEAFSSDLKHLLLHQKAAFNSPVWFNVGVQGESRGWGWRWDATKRRAVRVVEGDSNPQCSACFINSVEDSLESILDLAKTEGMLFKWGSGTGTNLSAIRESGANLSGGGRASGPVSFMRGYDAFAGVIKSGGKTRRAAKMVVLDADHPDVEDFIWCKAREEKKARTLVANGYDGSLDGDAYAAIAFQNANNSVRVTDEFMSAAVQHRAKSGKRVWRTVSRANRSPAGEHSANDLLRQMAKAAHECGDPGLQFDTTINAWNPVRNTGRISASNPCSEYMFLDDSACNLASLNLLKFYRERRFDVESFSRAVSVMILSQEILVDRSAYPTEKIARNSHDYRPLGLGYANLGALLMCMGLPYDSVKGRCVAAAVTALMHGRACETSADIAEARGAFEGYASNREPFAEVIEKHDQKMRQIVWVGIQSNLVSAIKSVWDRVLEKGRRHGFRNGQVTVIAPTGTIGLLMDCDTTGIEPDLALVKTKKLSGGGQLRILNGAVPVALGQLGYTEESAGAICKYLSEKGAIEGAGLRDEDLPVFDCSFPVREGGRCISWRGHVSMMAAVQPFVSGAISKTVNLPADATVDDVLETYIQAWRAGLKSIAVYRDGSKAVQPLAPGKSSPGSESAASAVALSGGAPGAPRRRLPDERKSITHRFLVGGHKGYVTVGLYDSGEPGEIFVRIAKEGSTISGLMDNFATAVSLALQHGTPLAALVDKFRGTRFEPSGWTKNPEIRRAQSITDYIFRWMGLRFLAAEQTVHSATEREGESFVGASEDATSTLQGPPCPRCGNLMEPSGSCYHCGNCGESLGCG